ncbi:MAG TPA: serine/threonine-protein kinase [Kofleriaceae bacterium]|jgi:serine/threonine-protein kinase
MGAPSPDDSGVVAIGSILDGRYRVDAVLGAGGMGRVYRGEHTGIGRAVAIKVLHSALGRNKEATQRFQREALASGRLDHANIVGVSDFGVLTDGSLYLVMEALEGEGLGARIERDKRIGWLEAVEIIRGVLAGLRHAHDRGVVHRDIKPDNIYLAKKDGEQIIKILDFGIAKLYAGNADDPAMTRAGLTVGTPAYLSPEQAVGGAITPASDLYSTSVVLFEMLTGRVPFDEKDPLAMLTAHVTREPPTFAETAPDLATPPALEAIVRHGLAKVSAERITSAVDYVRALDDVLRSAGYYVPDIRNSSSPIAIPTPPPGFATPMPFAADLGSAPTAMLPMGSMPTPVSGAIAVPQQPAPHAGSRNVIVVVIVLALIAAVALYELGRSRDRGDTSTTEPSPVTAPIPMHFGDNGVDRDTRIKAAIHDLEDGATCTDRKAAIPKLVELGEDPRSLKALKKARYRMYGGIAGLGETNANACLTEYAEAAYKALGGK